MGLVGCDAVKSVSDKDIQTVSLAEVRTYLSEQAKEPGKPKLLLIDPRSGQDYDAGHIPGARNVTLTQVPPEPPRDPSIERYQTLIVYGKDPGSATARAMTKRLMSLKYKDVFLFAGGMYEWRNAEQPIATNEGGG